MMPVVELILRDFIDDHRFLIAADFVTDRRLQFQLIARLKAEFDLVAYCATHPAAFCNTRNGGEAHACRTADDIKNSGHSLDPVDHRNVSV